MIRGEDRGGSSWRERGEPGSWGRDRSWGSWEPREKGFGGDELHSSMLKSQVLSGQRADPAPCPERCSSEETGGHTGDPGPCTSRRVELGVSQQACPFGLDIMSHSNSDYYQNVMNTR